MLSREVCKRCWTRIGCAWTDGDDTNWRKKRKVACALHPGRMIQPHEYSIGFQWESVDRSPPRRCPYEAEHVVCRDVE